MNYSMGESLADYGFKFFEFLHEPIFIVSKWGKVIRMNEAGRKLLEVTHLSVTECESNLAAKISAHHENKATARIRIGTGKHQLQLITTYLAGSDYFLVEVCR